MAKNSIIPAVIAVFAFVVVVSAQELGYGGVYRSKEAQDYFKRRFGEDSLNAARLASVVYKNLDREEIESAYERTPLNLPVRPRPGGVYGNDRPYPYARYAENYPGNP